ncbi:ABC-F family ATP-binding cassette domain-containing protein [Candidatus Entotheonella palauensis]|uniref:ABC-F family ATP-binding cassette domain-containing protein n=1 Tax=Candidatus Entotheonella palauensis TaxID=93172 RepID=UPI000B7CA626|nr:ABC-F family ATP-binding cassette domain-containing protein [Candidatus Entotheonella palauensis]
MIYLNQIKKQYGSKVLFSGIDLHIRPGDKIGLVGDNGMGKTTLFRLIEGTESADAGTITVRKGAQVGVLDQHFSAGQQTALERTVMGDAYFSKIFKEKEALENDHAAHAQNPAKWEKRYGHLLTEFERLGGYEREAKAKAILSGLGFKPSGWDQPLNQLSGGWAIRVELARLLLQNPDVLLLDEPSNHLDLRSVIWLEAFLKDYDGTIVLISHDRRFLNRIVNRIVHLDRGKLTIYHGNYDDFERQKEEREALLEQAAANQQKKINEMERFIERFRAKATKARQAQSRLKALEKIERIETASQTKSVHFRFPQPSRSGKISIAAKNLQKCYGDLVVYDDLSFQIERGAKIALVGENGAGKSTLLRLVAGVLDADGGALELGANVTRAYFAQHQSEILDPNLTVLETLAQVGAGLGRTQLQTILGGFRFSGDDVDKKTHVLSGGERSRLALARMLVAPTSLILLDEPTNHLDMKSCAVLAAALEDYEGTICVISHDRDFLDGFINRVWEIDEGAVKTYLGTYSDYEWKKAQEALPPAPVSGTNGTVSKNGTASTRANPGKPARRSNQYKMMQKNLSGLEEQLEQVMGQKEEIDQLLADSEIYLDVNKDKLMETLSQYEQLGSQEDELLEKIEQLTEELERTV